jgi:hypothetical protein
VLNGKDFREAAEMTNKYLFDYSDLSDFEQHVMKRIIPFYTWMRKKIPLQLEHVLSHPNIYKNINRASKDISDKTPEDERVSERDKNQFAQEWMQLPFNTIGKSGKAELTFFNQYGVIPVGDLNKLDARPAQAVKNVLTSMTPLAKLPLEIGMNKNLYFDSPISRGIGDTDDIPGVAQIPGRIMSAIQGEDYKPSQMSPELRYLLRNLNLLGSENIGKIIESSGETSSDQPMSDRALAAMSYATGMKSYSYDVDKYKEWAYRDRLKTLRDIKKREQMKRANKS